MTNSSINYKSAHIASADRMGFSVVNAVVIALLLWVGSTLNASQVALASLQVEVTQLRGEMKRSFDEDFSQRTRLAKAENDIAQLKVRMNINER